MYGAATFCFGSCLMNLLIFPAGLLQKDPWQPADFYSIHIRAQNYLALRLNWTQLVDKSTKYHHSNGTLTDVWAQVVTRSQNKFYGDMIRLSVYGVGLSISLKLGQHLIPPKSHGCFVFIVELT